MGNLLNDILKIIKIFVVRYEDVLYIDDGEEEDGEEYLPDVLKVPQYPYLTAYAKILG
jgi:hypothetical protein